MITAMVRSVFLKSEKFVLFLNCRETQHRALVILSLVFGVEKNDVMAFYGKIK